MSLATMTLHQTAVITGGWSDFVATTLSVMQQHSKVVVAMD
ncbi:hypothetical protein [Streptomyces adustus]